MAHLNKPIILHNKEPKACHREYKLEFEQGSEYFEISANAYDALAFKLDLKYRVVENPIFESKYLFTTISKENTSIRYFHASYAEGYTSPRLNFIIQDAIEISANAYPIYNKIFCYSPLHDLYFQEGYSSASLNDCFDLYHQNEDGIYTDFRSVFTDSLFEERIAQHVLLRY